MIRSNISIRTRIPELVEFFYPTYMKSSEFSPFISGGVIFSGDSKYLQSFRDNNIPYIYIKGTPEFDLTIPENLLTFVYDKWDKQPPAKLMQQFKEKEKSDEYLENIAKQVWVTGKYVSEDEASDKRLENLYKSLARINTYDFIFEYLSLSELMNPDKLFYSIQEFLKKVNNKESSKSAYTQRNIQDFREIRGKNVEKALLDYLYSPADNNELKMLKLIDTITKIVYDL